MLRNYAYCTECKVETPHDDDVCRYCAETICGRVHCPPPIQDEIDRRTQQGIRDGTFGIRTKPKRKAGPEGKVLRDCLDHLNKRGIRAWRNNTGAGNVRGRYMRFSVKGSSDIFGILKPSGRWLAVECKSKTGKVTPEQTNWLAQMKADGALVGVVRSVGELAKLLEQEGY